MVWPLLQDITDLFGADLPVEGGKGGEFAWCDGPLLAALKAGHWVVLDEVSISAETGLQIGEKAVVTPGILVEELMTRTDKTNKKILSFRCQSEITCQEYEGHFMWYSLIHWHSSPESISD